tara:strand:+ start:2479 stop:2766 length:288 start_codon:yes stop_codon:yes gene_type:complete
MDQSMFARLLDMFRNKNTSSGTIQDPQNTGDNEGATAGDDMGLPDLPQENGGGSSYVPTNSPQQQAVNMIRKSRGQVQSNAQPMQRLLSLFGQRR